MNKNSNNSIEENREITQNAAIIYCKKFEAAIIQIQSSPFKSNTMT